MPYTRRALLQFIAGTAAVAASPSWARAALSPPLSQRTAGIRLGVISGSFTFDTPPAPNGDRTDALIAKTKALGLKHLEIAPGDILPASLSAPAAAQAFDPGPYFIGPIPAAPPPREPGDTAPLPGLGAPRSREVRRWWLETKLSHFEGIRRKFNDAGINLECFMGNNWETDEELRRDFDIARSLGCGVLGRPYGAERVTRLAREAEKQKFPIYIHNEFERESDFVETLKISPIIRLNFDVGNYTSAGETNHLEVIRTYHDRISHLHLKARNKNGDFVEFGKSDSPVGDVLRLMRDQDYAFAAMIENERASRQARANIPGIEPTLASTGKAVGYVKQVLG